MDTKSSLELPEWLDAAAYSYHRDSVEYCYENGWITGLLATIEPFFQTWAEHELTNEPDIEFADTGRGFEAPHLDGEQLSFGNYYTELDSRTDLHSEFLEDHCLQPIDVLEDAQQLRNSIMHRTGYFETSPLDSEGNYNEYEGVEGFNTSPDHLVRLYEETLGISEEDSITETQIGNVELNFYPEETEDPNDFYSQSFIDNTLHAVESEPHPDGINYLNALATGMYHNILNPGLDENMRNGYTTRYNPAQPVSALLIYNWLENEIPEMIEEEYRNQGMDANDLPDIPHGGNHISLSDWVMPEIVSNLDILPSSTYPNALERPAERLREFEEIRDNLAHDVNTYNQITNLDVRDNIWHSYEIMHQLSDRIGYTTNEFELFGEEAEQQRRDRPYMTRSERLTSW